MLKVDHVHKVFSRKKRPPVPALLDVSMDARAAQVTGLVGADGAGKSTLIRLAAGLLVPTKGTVTVLGLDSVKETLQIQTQVGYMPQRFGLYQDLTVQENMDLYADLQGVPVLERPDRYAPLFKMTGLHPFNRRMVGDLSGGMKQKLGLACALIKSPQMLLLDEPTVGVDPVSRRELWKIVYQLVDKAGIGVLLSTAYLDEAEQCHHVVVLHDGAKIAEGTPQEFRDQIRGRVYVAVPPPDVRPRRIQSHLAGGARIVDATIRSGRVRVITRVPGPETIYPLLPQEWSVELKESTPCFEDAFMALIPRKEQGRENAGASPPTEKPAARDREPVVSVHRLSKFFGDFQAVKDLSFGVYRGEIFGLLGPNGAGKSTTFRMMCGLMGASGGKISVAGKDLRRARSRARSRLGYMAQQFSLYDPLSVQENLRFYGLAYGLTHKVLKQRMDWAFAEFGLGPWRDHVASGLPGGYKQRLAMAAALLHEPDILFLDEPTSGVDPMARREFWLRINRFAEQGVTVVVTTHFMEESEYCDRMLIMSQGARLALGTPGQIRDLARSENNPDPTIEDAFIALAQGEIGPPAHDPGEDA